MTDTPERIAAELIARRAELLGNDTPSTPAHLGALAVEDISAAGLVIVQAARMAEMMDDLAAARRALRLALPHLVESVESIVRGHSLSYDWEATEPLPEDCEPEALLQAHDMLAAIGAVRAALAEAST